MKTTVIPAQITTVEDKIAGSLNITQVVLLMVPVIFTTIVYAIFPPKLHLAIYKFPLVFIVLLISLILSLRIKDEVVLNWLIILLRYNVRAKYYVFNKNDTYLRNMALEKEHEKQVKLLNIKIHKKRAKAKSFTIKDSVKIKNFMKNPKISLSLKPNKKGGLYVAVSEIDQ